MLEIETVAVLGTDGAACGCAIRAALSGCGVRLHAATAPGLDAAFEAIRFEVDLEVEQGLLTRTDRQRILDGILFTTDLGEAVTGADLVFEAAAAAAERDTARLWRAAELARASTLLALPEEPEAELLAAGVPQPGRVLVLRVERDAGWARLGVAAAPGTAAHVLAAAEAFAARLEQGSRRAA